MEIRPMVRLRILEILAEQNHTKYWLFKRMDMSYQNFNRMVNNETKSIGDLFYQTTDESTD